MATKIIGRGKAQCERHFNASLMLRKRLPILLKVLKNHFDDFKFHELIRNSDLKIINLQFKAANWLIVTYREVIACLEG